MRNHDWEGENTVFNQQFVESVDTNPEGPLYLSKSTRRWTPTVQTHVVQSQLHMPSVS